MTTNAILINDENIKKMKELKIDSWRIVNMDPIGRAQDNSELALGKELIQGNVKNDDFVDVWENKFKWFRDLDKLKCKECKNCKDWKYCRGDSLDTWDFNNNRPKLCLSKVLEGAG